MVTKTLAALLLLALAVMAHAQRSFSPKETLSVKDVDSAQPEEVDSGCAGVDEFDKEMMTEEDRPPKLPTADEAKRVYEAQIARVKSEANRAGDEVSRPRVTPNPVFQYFSVNDWLHKPVSKCCPASVGYSCTSTRYRLPCFSSYYGGVREWCCPLWPSVYYARCNCSQCAVLQEDCAHEGRCQRRYSKVGFVAVCYRNNQWGFLRYIKRYLPTSCYCKT